jgi:hypothetical protein
MRHWMRQQMAVNNILLLDRPIDKRKTKKAVLDERN